jgi:AsmA protein
MRLGLPPLGIFGIPMNVSGTTDNPRIRLGKGSTDALEEKEDEEQVPVPVNENRLR